MTCDICQVEEVAFIIGNAASGEQQFLGPACFARMGLEFAKQLLPADEIAATLGPMFVAPAQEPAGEPGKAARGRKRQDATPEPEAVERPPGGAPETSAPAANE